MPRYLTQRLERDDLQACREKRQALGTLTPPKPKRVRVRIVMPSTPSTPSPTKAPQPPAFRLDQGLATVFVWHTVKCPINITYSLLTCLPARRTTHHHQVGLLRGSSDIHPRLQRPSDDPARRPKSGEVLGVLSQVGGAAY